MLLMAETLVLGPGQSHVAVPGLGQPIILFRHRDGLGMRHGGNLEVNGQPSTGRTILPPNAVVAGDEISFAIEPAA